LPGFAAGNRYNTPHMRTAISRRRFVAGSIRLAAVVPLIPLEQLEIVASRLGTADRRTLRAAANLIIPANERMPAASTVGAVSYIEKIAGSDRHLHDLLGRGLRAIDAGAAAAHQARFDVLAADRQIAVLAEIEKADEPAGFFAALRDLVYEAYYTHRRVMKLLRHDFRSGRARTARLEAFDEQRLARVRQMTPFYRPLTP
jgi:hypothetical protein